MQSTKDEVPTKRKRFEGRETTRIPQDTLLEVLLWLDRFDLDGEQITARRLRSLVENNRMPLRKVARVDYNGAWRRYLDPPGKRNTLSIRLEDDERGGPADVEILIETDAGAQQAASYLSSCVVRHFHVFGHLRALPRNELIAAPSLIHDLEFNVCNFDNGEEDTLSKTLNGSTFQILALLDSSIPAWQIDDRRLESLRLRGSNQLHVCPDDSPELRDDDDMFKVTEEGILAYCFTLDDGLPLPGNRFLELTWAAVTPAFFKKLVEASKNSQLTCPVDLCLYPVCFDISHLDVGVMPSRSERDDPATGAHVHDVRYDIDDHVNGIRLLIHFESEDDETWEVTLRRRKKHHEGSIRTQT